MRRADRLFRLVQLLRRSRLVTAQRLAADLEVSERTVYRDIRDLSLSGVPVRGEAGVGYALAQGFELPPLMFDVDELEALVLGARVVQAYADPALARAADSALAKVELVLPEKLRRGMAARHLIVPALHHRRGPGFPLGLVREAVRTKLRLTFDYVDRQAGSSSRTVRPLGLAFWGKVFSLATWCELRKDFRSFRVDRMTNVRAGAAFEDEPGKTLDDFVTQVAKQGAPGDHAGDARRARHEPQR